MKKAKPPVVAPQDGAITWACPTCGAEAHKHGRGGSDACRLGQHIGIDQLLLQLFEAV